MTNNINYDFGILTEGQTDRSVSGTLLYDRVLYKAEEQELIINNIFNHYESLVNAEENEQIINKFKVLAIHKLLIYSLFFKHSSFINEQEFRIVLNIHKGLNKVLKYRSTNGCIIPYVEVGYKNGSNNKLPIKNVCIGPRNTLDIAELGLHNFLSHYEYNDVNVKELKFL